MMEIGSSIMQGYIAETKRMVAVFVLDFAILPITHQKIKCDRDEIRSCAEGRRRIRVRVDGLHRMVKDLDGDGLDPAGRRVHFGIICQLTPEAQVNAAVAV
jgi:hypothetical protein